MVKDVTSKDLEASLTDGMTVLDLWAPWCGPCRMVSPILEELEEELPLTLLKMNIDEDPSVAQEFGVQSIPTLIVFKNGVPVEKVTGAYPKAQLKAFFEKKLEALSDGE